MNGREARESGLRLKGKVVPGPNGLSEPFVNARLSSRGGGFRRSEALIFSALSNGAREAHKEWQGFRDRRDDTFRRAVSFCGCPPHASPPHKTAIRNALRDDCAAERPNRKTHPSRMARPRQRGGRGSRARGPSSIPSRRSGQRITLTKIGPSVARHGRHRTRLSETATRNLGRWLVPLSSDPDVCNFSAMTPKRPSPRAPVATSATLKACHGFSLAQELEEKPTSHQRPTLDRRSAKAPSTHLPRTTEARRSL